MDFKSGLILKIEIFEVNKINFGSLTHKNLQCLTYYFLEISLHDFVGKRNQQNKEQKWSTVPKFNTKIILSVVYAYVMLC